MTSNLISERILCNTITLRQEQFIFDICLYNLNKLIETVKKLKDEVKNLYNEVVNYEHCENEDVKSVRNSVIAELKLAYREIKHWKFVTASKDIKATEIEKAKSTKHPTYVDMPSLRVVDTIKERWGLL